MRSSSACSLGIVALVGLGSSLAAAQPQPAIDGNAEATSDPSHTVVLGSTLFAASYGTAVMAASTSYPTDSATKSDRQALYLPVAGPMLSLETSRSKAMDVALVCDGVAQAAGIGILVYGLLHQRDLPTRTVEVRPMVGASAGVAVAGRF